MNYAISYKCINHCASSEDGIPSMLLGISFRKIASGSCKAQKPLIDFTKYLEALCTAVLNLLSQENKTYSISLPHSPKVLKNYETARNYSVRLSTSFFPGSTLLLIIFWHMIWMCFHECCKYWHTC